MANNAGVGNRLKNYFGNVQNHLVASFAIVIVLMLLLPVPGVFLDVLMICNIALSIVILLVVLYTPKSSDFTGVRSSFCDSLRSCIERKLHKADFDSGFCDRICEFSGKYAESFFFYSNRRHYFQSFNDRACNRNGDFYHLDYYSGDCDYKRRNARF